MKTHTTTDGEALARGFIISPAAFQSLFGDPEALTELARLLQVGDILSPPREDLDLEAVEDVEFSFAELAQFGEGQVHDPQRRQAIEEFLNKHDLLTPRIADPKAPTKDDTIRGAGDTQDDSSKPIP